MRFKKRTMASRAVIIWQLLKDIKPSDLNRYVPHFNELSFFEKVKASGTILGEAVLMPILRLFYILKIGDIPLGKKTLIMGALGYFILPVDLVPDFLPALAGFTDDLVVIAFVLKQVSEYSTPLIEIKARRAYESLCVRKVRVAQ